MATQSFAVLALAFGLELCIALVAGQVQRNDSFPVPGCEIYEGKPCARVRVKGCGPPDDSWAIKPLQKLKEGWCGMRFFDDLGAVLPTCRESRTCIGASAKVPCCGRIVWGEDPSGKTFDTHC